jgi:hypothetical protein
MIHHLSSRRTIWSDERMIGLTFDEDRLKEIYDKVVEEPNENSCKKGFIKCPECDEEILLIPTLRVMNCAIENHVHKHKEQLKDNPIIEHRTAIAVRLALFSQVLQKACKIQLS